MGFAGNVGDTLFTLKVIYPFKLSTLIVYSRGTFRSKNKGEVQMSNIQGKNTNEKLLLTENELKRLLLFMKGAINLEVKDYPSRWGKPAIKEVILEYTNGKKYIGNLYASDLKFQELNGLRSIQEHFARGNYGTNSYRGNCSGLIVKALIEQFHSSFFIDPMAGSGTSKAVCEKMGIPHLTLDLNPAWGGFDAYSMELERSSDMIFLHSPYYVYPGSAMPQYSGVQWGSEKLPTDGSHIHDEYEYTKWFNKVQANLYMSLRKGGHLCILMGDSRYKGKYYSMFKSMDIYGKLVSVIIKKQYNCFSDSISYSTSVIPIDHEYMVIIEKDNEYIIPCMIVKNIDADIMNSTKVTWRALVQSVVQHYGGKATRNQILDELKKHPKAKNNNHIEEKLRQIISTFKNEFVKHEDFDGNYIVSLAA